MQKRIKTKFNASPLLRIGLNVLVLIALAGCNLPVLTFPDLVVQPTIEPIILTPRPIIPQSTAILIPTEKYEPTPTLAPTLQPPYMYTTQSGDYLTNLAVRFGVRTSDILSVGQVPAEGLINPGMLMVIPHVLGETSPATRVLPDSEVVYSPASMDLDIKAFVKNSGGYLNTYTEYLYNATHSGAEVVQIVAQENSFNPRLLLGLLEYESHWVTGQPGNLAQSEYPLGNLDVNNRGLYKQLSWVIRQISAGYYGWRSSTLTTITFPDNTKLRISPEVNAGTVAVQVFFSKLYNRREWMGLLYAESGFSTAYEKLFGNPWVRTQAFEPFFPPNLKQPKLELPFYYDRIWSFSGGPHPAWAADSPRAALDFAPGSTESGCIPSQEWVLAAAPGLVIRSDNGVVVVDLDGDGMEQTGWVLLYLHIATDKRVALGTRLGLNDLIGHPSCEGGVATGTHFHFARKYNGEWILADGPMPFVLGGWQAHAGLKDYDGTLTKDGQTITACTCGSNETKISRPRVTGP